MTDPLFAEIARRRRPRFYAATRRLWRVMYDRGWTRTDMDDTLRSRITHALADWKRWYDWGHPVMWLVGRYDSGSAGSPRGRDMWWIPKEYVEGIYASMVADFEVRRGCYVTKAYTDVRDTSDIQWRIFDLQDDGRTVKIALWPCEPEHGDRLQPLPWQELTAQQTRLFIEWYLIDHKIKAQWFGLRRWVYFKALRNAVDAHSPFTCNAVPARRSGGYDHWHCQRRKWHRGEQHRFNNMVWTGEGRVEHQPEPVATPPGSTDGGAS